MADPGSVNPTGGNPPPAAMPTPGQPSPGAQVVYPDPMAQIRAQLGDERAAAWAETFAPPSDGAQVAPTGGGSGGASDDPVEGTLGLLGEERAQAWRDLLNGGGSGGQAGAGADPSAQDGGSGSGLFTTLEDGSTVQRDSSMAQLGHEGAVLVVTPKLFSTNGDGTWKEATFHFYPAGFDPDPENLEAGRLGTLTQSQYHDLLANLGSSDPATREAAESEARALGFGDRFFGKETKSVELAYDGYEGKIYQRGDSYLFRPGGDVEREKSVSSDEMSSLVARLRRGGEAAEEAEAELRDLGFTGEGLQRLRDEGSFNPQEITTPQYQPLSGVEIRRLYDQTSGDIETAVFEGEEGFILYPDEKNNENFVGRAEFAGFAVTEEGGVFVSRAEFEDLIKGAYEGDDWSLETLRKLGFSLDLLQSHVGNDIRKNPAFFTDPISGGRIAMGRGVRVEGGARPFGYEGNGGHWGAGVQGENGELSDAAKDVLDNPYKNGFYAIAEDNGFVSHFFDSAGSEHLAPLMRDEDGNVIKDEQGNPVRDYRRFGIHEGTLSTDGTGNSKPTPESLMARGAALENNWEPLRVDDVPEGLQVYTVEENGEIVYYFFDENDHMVDRISKERFLQMVEDAGEGDVATIETFIHEFGFSYDQIQFWMEQEGTDKVIVLYDEASEGYLVLQGGYRLEKGFGSTIDGFETEQEAREWAWLIERYSEGYAFEASRYKLRFDPPDVYRNPFGFSKSYVSVDDTKGFHIHGPGISQMPTR